MGKRRKWLFLVNPFQLSADGKIDIYFSPSSQYTGYKIIVDLLKTKVDKDSPNSFWLEGNQFEKVFIEDTKNNKKEISFDELIYEMSK